MSFELVIAGVCLDGQKGLVDIGVNNGRIAAIAPELPNSAARYHGCGCFAFGGYVESHIHLDKACILDRCEICEGTLPEAVSETAKAKARFTQEDVYARAKTVIERSIGFGTVAMRSFVEIDPRAGFRSFEALRQIRKDYQWAIDLQLCAFAQEGLTGEPETLAMLEQALQSGADLLGGCPYTDPDPQAHIRQIFELAAKYGVDVDFHLDFDLDPQKSNIDHVVSETEKHGYQGRVSIGHVTKLSAMPQETVNRIADQLAKAGIAVTVLPSTDLFLLGRDRDHLIPRGLAPAMLLASRGVNVTVATNNVLNPFTPFGDASLGRMGNMFANIAQLAKDDDIASAFQMVSANPAKLIGRNRQIEVGELADIILLDAADALSSLREIRMPVAGWKSGRQTFARPAVELFSPYV